MTFFFFNLNQTNNSLNVHSYNGTLYLGVSNKSQL